MTEQQRLEIVVGMRVMVKVASREIPATVVEVGENWFLVRSDSTGREFKTTRVVDILDAHQAEDNAEIAQAAADIADEEAATAELRSREENGEADEPKTEQPKEDESKADEPKSEQPKEDESKADEPKSEQPKADEPKAEEPPQADEAAPAVAETAAAPRRNLSLVDAAVEVLRAEKRPMGVKELVKLATERGLWIPTKAKTPEQSLYGGLYLEMKNSSHPRIRKSAEKGRFELIG